MTSGTFRAIALVAAYNEADIISAVIGHLVGNGVDVYLLDNRSTDGTAAEASRWLGKGLLAIEPFPGADVGGVEPARFDWTAVLRRKEELAGELDADWFLHHDADEIREAPWPGMSLRDGIRWVDRLGYNCIDFRVFNFPPTDDRFETGMDPREHFRYWEEAREFDIRQLKAWKNTGAPPSLIPSGGHEVGLPNRQVFPIPFLLRHYPIRNQAHGRRKVFEERKGRFVDRERARRWHIQYDAIVEENHDFLADPASLRPFDLEQVRLELMLDNAITRHERWLADQARSSLADRSSLENELSVLRERLAALEELASERERRRAEAEERAAGVVARLESAMSRISALERDVGFERGRAAELAREEERK